MSNQDQKLDKIIDIIEALARAKISETIEKELTDATKKKLYQLTGKKQRNELVKLTGLSAGTISGLWQRWHSVGILKKKGKFYYKVFEEEREDDRN